MNPIIFSLATLVFAEVDPYQSIGQQVGSVYQKIGSIASAGTCANEEIRSVHDAAQTAISSLRYQIGTINWNLYVGASAASIYTSQLGDYIDGLSTVNQHLVGLMTSEEPMVTPRSKGTPRGVTPATTVASATPAVEATSSVTGTVFPRVLAESASKASENSKSKASPSSKAIASSSVSPSASSTSSRSGPKSSSSSSSSNSVSNEAVTFGTSLGILAAAFIVLV